MSEENTHNSWVEILLRYMAFLMIAGLVFAFFYPIYVRMEENRLPNICQGNLKQIAIAAFQYSQDYDERLPLVNVNDAAISATAPLGWADALRPYLHSPRLLQCNKENDQDHTKQPASQGYTDYWYNARLNGLQLKAFTHPASTLLHGEGNDGTDATNARYSLKELPTYWSNADAPAMRHLDGANYAFVDGHVKWLKPETIINEAPGKALTFRLR